MKSIHVITGLAVHGGSPTYFAQQLAQAFKLLPRLWAVGRTIASMSRKSSLAKVYGWTIEKALLLGSTPHLPTNSHAETQAPVIRALHYELASRSAKILNGCGRI